MTPGLQDDSKSVLKLADTDGSAISAVGPWATGMPTDIRRQNA
jgi:hypothetical protein